MPEFKIFKLNKHELDYVQFNNILTKDYDPKCKNTILTAFRLPPELLEKSLNTYFILARLHKLLKN